jgi:hypothetical protein
MSAPPEYHVETLNERLDRNKRIAARSALLFEAVILAFAASAVIAFGPRLVDGTITGIQEAGLVVMLLGTCALSYQFAGQSRLNRPGARTIRLTEAGVEAEFPSGQTAKLLWNDPSVAYELLRFRDYGAPTPSRTPYYLKVNAVMTALTEEAYMGVLHAVTDRGLVVSTVEGFPWYRLVLGRPLVTSVRGRASPAVSGSGPGPS